MGALRCGDRTIHAEARRRAPRASAAAADVNELAKAGSVAVAVAVAAERCRVKRAGTE